MDQAEELCDYVCIIAGGEKVLDGRLRDVKRANMGQRYSVEFDDGSTAAEAFMSGNSRLFQRATRRGDRWEFDLADGASPKNVLAAINGLDAPLMCFARVQPSLHEIFVQKVGRASTPVRRPEATDV
ncbi:MAG: DUF4162 domain-containing protein [Gemmatimonadaceae bacterium]